MSFLFSAFRFVRYGAKILFSWDIVSGFWRKKNNVFRFQRNIGFTSYVLLSKAKNK